jgi:hypothetical protein
MDTCKEYNDANNLNYGQMFFMTLGFLPFLLIFPCWIVSRYVFEPMMTNYESRFQEMVDLLHVPVPYEERYPVKDSSSNSVTTTNNIVMDKTPEGYVAMQYNNDTEAFEYWCDKTISYKYLETVSRKYVNSFGCGSLYIDRMGLLKEKVNKIREEIKENLKKKEQDNGKKDHEKEENNKKDDDNVFANLKKYKTSTKEDLKTKLTKNDVVCDEANKYIRKGKFSDHTDWMASKQDVKEESTTSSSSGGMMSWLEWKTRSKKD